MSEINVEVIYALKLHQTAVRVRLPERATVREALVRSGLFQMHPELDPDRCETAIWGRLVDIRQPLRDGDRIEICRALQADPKTTRRLRARGKRV